MKSVPVEKWDWKQAFRLWAFHEENEKLALTGAQSINVERYFEKVLSQAIQAAKEEERKRINGEIEDMQHHRGIPSISKGYLLDEQEVLSIINKHQ